MQFRHTFKRLISIKNAAIFFAALVLLLLLIIIYKSTASIILTGIYVALLSLLMVSSAVLLLMSLEIIQLPGLSESIQSTREIIIRYQTRVWRVLRSTINALNQWRVQEHSQVAPLYLLMGPEGSGKSTLLQHAELISIDDAPGYRESSAYHIHAFQQAYFLEIKPDADAKQLSQSLKLWRRRRRMNGIICVIDISTLLNPNACLHYLTQLSTKVNSLQSLLHMTIPLYLVLSKADQLAGFTDFFTDFSRETTERALGFELSEGDIETQRWHDVYTQWHAQVKHQLLWVVDQEVRLAQREAAIKFSHQLILLETTLNQFFVSAQKQLTPEKIGWRGVYFASAIQESARYDLVSQVLNHDLSFQTEQHASPVPSVARSLFIKHLFTQQCLIDAEKYGLNERVSRLREISQYLIQYLIPSVCCVGMIGLGSTLWQNSSVADDISKRVATIAIEDSHSLSKSTKFSAVQSYLHDVKSLPQIIAKMSYALWGRYAFNTAYQHLEARVVHAMIMPRVVMAFEKGLQQERDLENRFVLLAAYQAINQPAKKAILLSGLRLLSIQDSVPDYIFSLLDQVDTFAMPPIRLNTSLIEKLSASLADMPRWEQVYAYLLVYAHSSTIDNLALNRILGSDGSHLFDKNVTKHIVPNLFTANGYQTIVKLHLSQIIAKQVDQNSTREASIYHQVEQHYWARYRTFWQETLSALKIRHISSISELNDVYASLTMPLSALGKLYRAIATQISVIPASYQQQLAQSESLVSSYDAQLKMLQKLRDDIQMLHDAEDPNQAALDYLTTYFTKYDKQSAFAHCQSIMAKLPLFYQRWLQQINQETWNTIQRAGFKSLNSTWQETLYPQGKRLLNSAYPVKGDSQQDINQQQLAKWLLHLEQFRHTYLQAFINTKSHHWQNNKRFGHSAALSPSTLRFFAKADRLSAYFATDAKTPTIHLGLSPRVLSANATQVTLNLGDKQLVYAHGPRDVDTVHWPFTGESNDAEIVITDFKGNTHSRRYMGDFALFRLLNKAHIVRLPELNSYLLKFNIDGLTASYTMTTDTPLSILRLSDFQHFSLPEILNEVPHDSA